MGAPAPLPHPPRMTTLNGISTPKNKDTSLIHGNSSNWSLAMFIPLNSFMMVLKEILIFSEWAFYGS